MQHPIQRLRVGILAVSVVMASGIGSTAAQTQGTADGIAVYLGVVPAEIVQDRHPGADPKAGMHGGVPEGRHRYHVMVSLFDTATGERIDDVAVTAAVGLVGHGASRRALEPMTIANALTYGG